MDYELALKLKNAGFPQTGEIGDWFYVNQELEVICAGNGYECDCPLTTYDIKNPYKREIVKAPKLEELIEACGDKLEALVRIEYPKGTVHWQADMSEDAFENSERYKEYPCVRDCCGHKSGSTPREAVAKLWLELNKK